MFAPERVPLPRFLRTAWHHAHAFYAARWLPAQCPFCHAWPVWQQPGGICASCLVRYTPPQQRCLRCALALRQPESACPACTCLPSPLRHCVAAVDYGYPWHQAVEAFKFHQRPAWADAMAQLLLRQPLCEALLQQAECMVPIPLATARLRERGYNQAWELGKALRRSSGIAMPCITQGIERRHVPQAQARLPRQQRLQRRQQLYSLKPADRSVWVGRKVLLVDDVMTTGATLFALADLLLAAGATHVDALVFARTPLV
ncbi:ComF family protein [Lampropedia aestuarii]|uniref:ComF family protein n=1 Tax=Lampropedia aestuarii TaxID=2562762 RepID=UPI00246979F9|nr:phosphoribosyltransferase family protein [Lampropedia aestuarii]MDH5856402.1 phosphoribosyltransferase family protein [Lampropedia aestuarii]